MSRIITLCGSARFENEFVKWNKALSLAGHVVLSLAVYPSSELGVKSWYSDKEKLVMDEVHLRKIDISDTVMVLNKFAYIGQSTLNEIAYAKAQNKNIIYLESWGKGIGVTTYHHTKSLQARAKLAGVELPTSSPLDTSGPHPWKAYDLLGNTRIPYNDLIKIILDS